MAYGGPTYYIDIEHRGLNKYRRIRGKDKNVVERQADAQIAQWDEQWARQQSRLQRANQAAAVRTAKERERAAREEYLASRQAEAEERTEEAQAALEAAESILEATLAVNDAVDWDALLRTDEFAEPPPARPVTAWEESGQSPRRNPAEPREDRFTPTIGLFDKLIPGQSRRKRDEARRAFEQARSRWEKQCEENAALDRRDKDEHDRELRAWEEALRSWEERKKAFERERDEGNVKILEQKDKYLSNDEGAVEDYCRLVLERSNYPDFISKNFDVSFNSETGVVIIDFRLPTPNELPTVHEVKYVKSSDQIEEKHLSKNKMDALYDSVVYQISLRVVHEMFESDVISILSSIVFNGYTEYTDPATGKDASAYIVSLQVPKEKFADIRLSHIDPKECFKRLKGVSAARLTTLTPVAPIARIDTEDRRFVEGRAILGDLQEGMNLAAIEWEDFEHLIRELFEQEFASGGGEVKVTRASRDGGVDAVIFDPDPLRGGKIVVQAKRYTNAVGVSSVRDLYGTLMNEGANKGILVTTSNFGSDAYEFAKDKPLTLLDGGHLLHLLQKHGRKAFIDLKQAKLMNKES